jgi:hypothetical protein
MSTLAEHVARFGANAFAITVSGEHRDVRPHVAPVRVEAAVDGSLSVLLLPGSRTERNAVTHEIVCLHWPGRADTDGYSLIVDGKAAAAPGVHDTELRLQPVKAVLHRLGAPGHQTNACGHDCVGISLP